MVERMAVNHDVVGSSPTAGAIPWYQDRHNQGHPDCSWLLISLTLINKQLVSMVSFMGTRPFPPVGVVGEFPIRESGSP